MGNRPAIEAAVKTGDPDKAAAMLDGIKDQPVSPIIRHRVLLVRGDLSFARSHYEEAITLYEAANTTSAAYGGENDRSLFQPRHGLRQV